MSSKKEFVFSDQSRTNPNLWSATPTGSKWRWWQISYRDATRTGSVYLWFRGPRRL